MRAQEPDPDIFQNWFLYGTYYVGSTDYIVDEIKPPIQPSFLLDQTLGFSGVGACNTFTGTFSYDAVGDFFTVATFDATSIDCGHPIHADFEMTYFGYFLPTNNYYYYYHIEAEGNGGQWFFLDVGLIQGIVFRNAELVVTENLKQSIKLFPNPVSQTLFITSEGSPVEHISIYAISGKRIISEAASTNQLDVSGLKAGLYFAEIATSEGKSIQKFIKK